LNLRRYTVAGAPSSGLSTGAAYHNATGRSLTVLLSGLGEAVQVDSMKLNLKPAGTERSELKRDDPL
jgi:hypothetical protein